MRLRTITMQQYTLTYAQVVVVLALFDFSVDRVAAVREVAIGDLANVGLVVRYFDNASYAPRRAPAVRRGMKGGYICLHSQGAWAVSATGRLRLQPGFAHIAGFRWRARLFLTPARRRRGLGVWPSSRAPAPHWDRRAVSPSRAAPALSSSTSWASYVATLGVGRGSNERGLFATCQRG
jgi:hypothetical protein